MTLREIQPFDYNGHTLAAVPHTGVGLLNSLGFVEREGAARVQRTSNYIATSFTDQGGVFVTPMGCRFVEV